VTFDPVDPDALEVRERRTELVNLGKRECGVFELLRCAVDLVAMVAELLLDVKAPRRSTRMRSSSSRRTKNGATPNPPRSHLYVPLVMKSTPAARTLAGNMPSACTASV
jgi:hypothetical protein